MTSKPSRPPTELENLLIIAEAIDQYSQNKNSSDKPKIIRALSAKTGIGERRIRDFWRDPDYLKKRIEKARFEVRQIRMLLEFERLLCWPMESYLNLMGTAIMGLYEFSAGKRTDRTSTYKNNLYGLFSYGLDLNLREFRFNEKVKERAKERLNKWDKGDYAVHCTPIEWTQESKIKGDKKEELRIKKRVSLLMLVADRHHPRVNFVIIPSNIPEDYAEEELKKLIENLSSEKKRIFITSSYENGRNIPTIKRSCFLSKFFSEVIIETPTCTKGPIVFSNTYSSKGALEKEIHEVTRKIRPHWRSKSFGH